MCGISTRLVGRMLSGRLTWLTRLTPPAPGARPTRLSLLAAGARPVPLAQPVLVAWATFLALRAAATANAADCAALARLSLPHTTITLAEAVPACICNGKVDRTRPLRPLPQVSIYKGSGSTDEAGNLDCAAR